LQPSEAIVSNSKASAYFVYDTNQQVPLPVSHPVPNPTFTLNQPFPHSFSSIFPYNCNFPKADRYLIGIFNANPSPTTPRNLQVPFEYVSHNFNSANAAPNTLAVGKVTDGDNAGPKNRGTKSAPTAAASESV
jgi:hypothetical protein